MPCWVPAASTAPVAAPPAYAAAAAWYAARDLVHLDAKHLARMFAMGKLDSFARPLGSGDVPKRRSIRRRSDSALDQEVRESIGRSTSPIYADIKKSTFPEGTTLGSSTKWKQSGVLAWIDGHAAKRGAS